MKDGEETGILVIIYLEPDLSDSVLRSLYTAFQMLTTSHQVTYHYFHLLGWETVAQRN